MYLSCFIIINLLFFYRLNIGNIVTLKQIQAQTDLYDLREKDNFFNGIM